MTDSEAAQQRGSEGPEPRLPETMIFPGATQKQFQEQCKALDGRIVCKVFPDPHSNRRAKFWGTVHYRGILGRPHFFEVRYTDRDSETMSLSALRKILLPAHARIPPAALPPPETGPATRGRARRAGGAPTAASAAAGASPVELLAANMPGEWDDTDQRRALEAAAAYLKGLAPHVHIPATAVESLLSAVDVATCLGVLDPWADGRAVAEGLAAARVRVSVGLRGKPYQHNALSPAFYQQVQGSGAIEAIVTAPWPPLLDIALPLAVLFATRVACCHVPLSYVCDAPQPRKQWLAQLRSARRLFFVHPRDPTAGARAVSGGVWLVIIRAPAVAGSVLKSSGPWSTIL